MSEEKYQWKFLIKRTCPKCGKDYGRTNLTYEGIELGVACDCLPANEVLFVDSDNLHFVKCDVLEVQ